MGARINTVPAVAARRRRGLRMPSKDGNQPFLCDQVQRACETSVKMAMGGSTFGRSEARCDEDEGCLPDVIEKEKDERQKQRS